MPSGGCGQYGSWGSVGDLPILMIQDPAVLQGAIEYDCRHLLLPVFLQLKDIGPLPLRPTVVSATLAAPPRENDMAVSVVGPEGVAIPDLGVTPLTDPGTELDEPPTPHEDSPSMSTSGRRESSGGSSCASGRPGLGITEGTS